MHDAINGAFELLGGCLLWINVRKLIADKQLKGVSLLPSLFFTSWGVWNLFYYSHLGQFWSLLGGINIAIANTVWLVLAWRYRRNT